LINILSPRVTQKVTVTAYNAAKAPICHSVKMAWPCIAVQADNLATVNLANPVPEKGESCGYHAAKTIQCKTIL
jgi:hypothetical protein